MSEIVVRTTARCRNTQRILFCLEEAELPYQTVVEPPGWFDETYGRSGPMLEDGDARVLEVNAILRHVAREHAPGLWSSRPAEVDSWMDYALTGVRPALLEVVRAAGGDASALGRAAAGPSGDALRAALRLLDGRLGETFLVGGALSLADLSLAGLAELPLGPGWKEVPRLDAWRAALVERPAWRRAVERTRALQGGAR